MIQSAIHPSASAALPRWCVSTTKPGEEKLAKREIEHLMRRTPAVLEVYLPMRQGHRSSRNPIQPFIPRHVFVRLDFAASGWAAIFSTHGVQSMLMAGERPGWVRDQRIDDIRGRECDGLVVLDDAPIIAKPAKVVTSVSAEGEMPCPWEPGDRVTLPDLPWEAVFSKRLDRNRAEVLISVLGSDSKPARVQRHLSEIRPAPST